MLFRLTPQSTAVLFFLFLALCRLPSAQADTLRTDGGEVIRGKLVRIEAGTLIFLTTLAGQMLAPMDTIDTLTTENNLVLSMADGAVRYGSLEAEAGQQFLKPLDGGRRIPINLAEIEEAMVIPKAPKANEGESLEAAQIRWRQEVRTGILQRFGAADHSAAFLSLGLQYPGESAQFESAIRTEMHDQGAFPEVLDLDTALAGVGEAPLQPAIRLEVERNRYTGLRLRTGISLGLRYAPLFYAGLQTEFGIQAAYESWRPPPATDPALSPAETQQEGALNARLSLRYARDCFAQGAFTQQIMLYPSLSEPGDWRAASETAFSLPLKAGLKLRLDLLLEYDNAPLYHNVNSLESAIGASLQWRF